MLRPGLGEKGVEMAGDLGDRGVRVLRKREVDREPAHPAVVRDEATGDVARPERDLFRSRETRVVE